MLASPKGAQRAAPLRGMVKGLTASGREMVRRLESKKIFCDLAHVSKKGFWDAVEEHDASMPLLVTHTGVSGAFEHWRNLDDDQLRAVADSGGTVGIMYQSESLSWPFTSRGGFSRPKPRSMRTSVMSRSAMPAP